MLTLLGIVIGVASVIAMLAIGDGAKQAVIDRISAMGTNLLLVRPGAPNQRGFQNTATLVLADVQAIDREVPNVLAAVPEQSSTATLRFGGADYPTSVTGTSAKFPLARNWPVARGIFFSDDDERDYATVAVLGQTVAESAVPGRRGPARPVRAVNNLLFQVIGVMAPRGASPTGQDQDDVVLVPYATSQLRLSGQRFLRNVTVAVDDVDAHRRDAGRSRGAADAAPRHGRLPDPQHGVDPRDRDRDAEHADDPARLDRGDLAAGGRHRRDEHHAGERHRAHARDRHPHGDRRAHAQHPAAVPDRGAGGVGASAARSASCSASAPPPSSARSARRCSSRSRRCCSRSAARSPPGWSSAGCRRARPRGSTPSSRWRRSKQMNTR